MRIQNIITTLALMALPLTALAQNTNTPAVDRTLTTANANTSVNALSNVNDAHQQRQQNIKKLRDPAKLLPLLFVPLAILLYLTYEHFSNRRK